MQAWWPARATTSTNGFRFLAYLAKWLSMESQCVHKTFKYKLPSTPAQEQALETVVSRCRTLYNTALEQRKTWWERGQGKPTTYYQQKAELPDLKAACAEFAEVNAQVFRT
jgi:hypothetical protein